MDQSYARVALEPLAACVPGPSALGDSSHPIRFCELAPAQAPRVDPAFWSGDGDLVELRNRTVVVPPCRIYALDGATRCVGSLGLIRQQQLLDLPYACFAESSRFPEARNAELVRHADAQSVLLHVPDSVLRIDGPAVLLTQHADHVWGHWLVDVIPRLASALEHFPDATYVFSDRMPRALELLSALDLLPRHALFCNPQACVVDAGMLILPGYARVANAFAPFGLEAFRGTAVEPDPARKLYVSRAGFWKGSSLANHTELESAAQRHGYRIVHPETLTVAEQLALFAGASRIVGEYGSGLHLSLCAQPGTKVLVLQSAAMRQFVQSGIGWAARQPTGYVFGHPLHDQTQDVHNPERPCTLDLTELERALEWLDA